MYCINVKQVQFDIIFVIHIAICPLCIDTLTSLASTRIDVKELTKILPAHIPSPSNAKPDVSHLLLDRLGLD